jgi:hypothetical protein
MDKQSKQFPIVLAITTGRCGTTFLQRTLSQKFAGPHDFVTHEYLRQNITKVGPYHRVFNERSLELAQSYQIGDFLRICAENANKGVVADTGWTMRSLIPLLAHQFPDRLRVLHIHRHPIQVAASFAVMGSYSVNQSKNWALDPFDKSAAYPEFQGRWKKMTPFEKCLYMWLEINSAAFEFVRLNPYIPVMQVPSIRLFSDKVFLSEIAEFCGFQTNKNRTSQKSSVKKNKLMQMSLETRPIDSEWSAYLHHPEVIKLGESLGYDMTKDNVARMIEKYQLPKGFWPWIRHRSNYWVYRKRVGDLLRNIGLR